MVYLLVVLLDIFRYLKGENELDKYHFHAVHLSFYEGSSVIKKSCAIRQALLLAVATAR